MPNELVALEMIGRKSGRVVSQIRSEQSAVHLAPAMIMDGLQSNETTIQKYPC
jgi:hypothetical protein